MWSNTFYYYFEILSANHFVYENKGLTNCSHITMLCCCLTLYLYIVLHMPKRLCICVAKIHLPLPPIPISFPPSHPHLFPSSHPLPPSLPVFMVCDESPCREGESCGLQAGSYVCVNCSTSPCNPICELPSNKTFACVCPPGYTGATCETPGRVQVTSVSSCIHPLAFIGTRTYIALSPGLLHFFSFDLSSV